MVCHQRLLAAAIDSGFYPYRLGNHSMNSLPAAENDYDKFLARIKQMLDPANILAPGRYLCP